MQTWALASLGEEEFPTEYMRFWCWRLWTYEVSIDAVADSEHIFMRAWDDGLNTQPRDLTWNALGMMNNCWYKLEVSPVNGGVEIVHPVLAGNLKGGWMNAKKSMGRSSSMGALSHSKTSLRTRVAKADSQLVEERITEEKASERFSSSSIEVAPEPSNPNESPEVLGTDGVYTWAEIAAHDMSDDCWIVIKQVVYNVTSYIDEHPGGETTIMAYAGRDATSAFESIHSKRAFELLAQYKIGTLSETEGEAPVEEEPVHNQEKFPCVLGEVEAVTADCRRLRFMLPGGRDSLRLKPGQHISLYATIGESLITRQYTPISKGDAMGYFDLLIKVYFKDVHPRFPLGGMMSQFLDNMKVGQTIDVSGPFGLFNYQGKGSFSYCGKQRSCQHYGAVAGGTGITPILQVIRAIVEDPEDLSTISLIYANRTPDDILCRDVLDRYAKEYPTKFRVWYTVDSLVSPDDPWPYSVGYVSLSMLSSYMPAVDKNPVFLMCGPPPMFKYKVTPCLNELGYKKDGRIVL